MKFRLIFSFGILLLVGCYSSKKTSIANTPYKQQRYLILTADDYGASNNINEGIELAADKKIINSITALSNFPESLARLKRISENHPEIGIGVHLNITTGRPILGADKVPSLVDSAGNFHTFDALLLNLENISIYELKDELKAQILTFKEMNIPLDHLSDQHGIITLYGPFFSIVTELAIEFKVPIRSPILAGAKYPKVFTNPQIKKRKRQTASQLFFKNPFKAKRLIKHARIKKMEERASLLDELGIEHPDFLIISFWGEPSRDNFYHIIENLPIGVSEISFHFGTATREANYPSGLDLEYFKNREKELNTLTNDSIKPYIEQLNIKTIGFSELSTIKE